MTRKQVIAAALKLPPKKRAALTCRLIQSLERKEQKLSLEEWEKLWVKECERRLAELREGKAEEIDGEEVFVRERSSPRRIPTP